MKNFLMLLVILMFGNLCPMTSKSVPPASKPKPVPPAITKTTEKQVEKHQRKTLEGKKHQEEKNQIREMQKKVRELKKFKLETIRQNLKDSKTVIEIINKKITELNLTNAAFDSLRATTKKTKERMAINRMENQILQMKTTLKVLAKGFSEKKSLKSLKTKRVKSKKS